VTDATPSQFQTLLAAEFDRQGWQYDLGLGPALLAEVEKSGSVDAQALAISVPAAFLQVNRTTRENLAAAINRAVGGRTVVPAKEVATLVFENHSHNVTISGHAQVHGSNFNLGDGTQFNVSVELASIPDVNQLHTLFTSPPDSNALTRWAALDVCQGLLADPLSTEPADVARRAAFRDRVIAYNGALARACAEFKRCRWDRNAVFDASFTRDDVATVSNTEGLPVFPFDALPVFGPGFPNSTADYFHPSLQGQALLAETTWGTTFRDFVARGQGALSH
jgi:hypothetical protein